MPKQRKNKNQIIENAVELYGIDKWGAGYFDINENGDVVVTPFGKGEDPGISIYEIIQGIEERGLSMPVLLRIENILGSQIKLLNESFNNVFKEIGYKGTYKGVYPVKVNQQEQVIEAISKFGREYNHGFEAGSKPELIAAISMLDNPDACLICNGYKDEEFIDLGLFAVKMGLQCFFVIEVPGEVDLIIERAKKLNIKPLLGIRVKLSSQAESHWSESGGETSVFGLNMSQSVIVLDKLKQENMLDCLKLLHYHIGSQISNIRDIRVGAHEACRMYEELVNEGAPMGYIDFGGGLAVDYDGSNTNFHSSRNYSIEEYCYDIVETIMTVFDKKNIPHPTIITESGRAIVAYYSVLLFNILDVSEFCPGPIPENLPESANDILENLLDAYNTVSVKNIQECCNDALFYRNQARQLFKHGQINLRVRAYAENIFRNTLLKISETSKSMDYIPEDVIEINKMIHDIYYGNFSLFQSLPDVWAIHQLFPVIPVHRHNEEPTHPAIISDITCDSDGKIDKFPDYAHKKRSILLHDLKDDEEYYLGVFLVGAYQETLGDLHNLFGDTNVVTVYVDKTGSYRFINELEGDSVSDVLSYVEYDIKAIKNRIRKQAENAVHNKKITVKERKMILSAFDEGLRGYTYFEKE